MYDVIVIGGGAAGLMAAGTAASLGANTILLEKNNRPGKKLLITGKGRCNVTNAAAMSDFMDQIPADGRFLYSAFAALTNEDLRAFLDRAGVATKVERGGRVFPVSDKSADVLRALTDYAGQTLRTDCAVQELYLENGSLCGVTLSDGKTLSAGRVIVATGGASYPQTGSTGDGYRLARQAGHSVVPIRPSLVPLETKEDWPKEAMGLSLRNVSLSALDESGKLLFFEQGELLFTHFGLSGPLVLSASAHMRDFHRHQYTITIDLKPALDEARLDARLLRDFAAESNKDFINSLGGLLPQKLIPIVARLSGIDPRKKVHEITKTERAHLVALLKGLTVHITKPRPIKEAIITAGGVATKELVPKTMESRLLPGLYFAGEVLDVDAYTGGYNLQIAFSTGYLAGKSAAESLWT
ncbi:MAG: NAD(P)/FAD-dependent oxidoreductase [Ruminococcaceae bacterium]|nr:NAD(P)/FAD-dependent oxidoreductase [Oscillospiraceae bacterium]